MAIITISRKLGSLGDEIAVAVADKLGYDHINKQKIGEALADQGLRASEIEKYDEKKPSIWDSFSEQRKSFLYLIQETVYDFAKKKNVVIVGRGSQIILHNLPGVLHIRIIAPFETRMNRLMTQKGYDEKNAEQILRQNDRDSSGYISSFFEADWDDEGLYDLVVNTKAISVDTGLKLIMDTLSAYEFKEVPDETIEKLSDLVVTQKVEVALMGIPGLDWERLDVEKGIVNLSGTTNSEKNIDECKRIISSIKGVKSVDSRLVLKKWAY